MIGIENNVIKIDGQKCASYFWTSNLIAVSVMHVPKYYNITGNGHLIIVTGPEGTVTIEPSTGKIERGI